LRPNLQVPIFKIFVGWCPKKVPKVPFFFSLEGTLPATLPRGKADLNMKGVEF